MAMTGTAPVLENARPEGAIEYRKLLTNQNTFFPGGPALPPIHVKETAAGFQIAVPVGDIDLRRVWVFASPRAIRIEIRSRAIQSHAQAGCEEVDEQRIVRELKLPHAIQEGRTCVMPLGNELQIACLKDGTADDATWAELLHFDTRASIGCI